MSGRSRYYKNAGLNVGGFITESLGTIFIVPYVIRALGLELYGLVAAVVAVSMGAQMLGQAVVAATISHVARINSPLTGIGRFQQEIVHTRVGLLMVSAMAAIMSTLILLANSHFIAWLRVPIEFVDEAARCMLATAFLLPLALLSAYVTAILRGRQAFRAANTFKLVATVIRVASIITFFELFGPSVLAFVVLRTATFAIEGLLGAAWLLRQTESASADMTAVLTEANDRSMAIMIGGLLLFTLGNVMAIEAPKILVGRFCGLVASGIWGAAAMALSFLQRLVQAAAVAINPAVSSLDASAESAEGDRLVLEAGLVSSFVCGVGAVATLPAWAFVAPIWLQSDLGANWIVPGLLFAAQGSVSAVAPAVQGAYGRGRVVGLSLVHVLGNLLTLLAVVAAGLRGVSFAGMAGIVAAGRIATAILSLIYLGQVVFPTWAGRESLRLGLSIMAPWLFGLGTLLVLPDGAPPWLSLAVAAVSAAICGILGWMFVFPNSLRKMVITRLIGGHHA